MTSPFAFTHILLANIYQGCLSRSLSYSTLIKVHATLSLYDTLIEVDRTPPLPTHTHTHTFGGPPKFIKREKPSRVCAPICCILVLNSYPEPHPFQNPVSAPGREPGERALSLSPTEHSNPRRRLNVVCLTLLKLNPRALLVSFGGKSSSLRPCAMFDEIR